MNDKVIGILGGMGPEASAKFFLDFTKATNAKRDQDHFRVIIDSNVKIPDRTTALLSGGESPVPEMVKSINTLEKAGADLAVITCITAHNFFDEVNRQTNLKMINALEVLNEYIHENYSGKKLKIGVIGTNGTKATRIFEKYLKDVEIIYPDNSYQDMVMNAIFGDSNGIVVGIKNASAGDNNAKERVLIIDASQHLISNGADMIIAGCTEIPIVLKNGDISVPVLNPMDVLIQYLLKLN